MLDVTCTVTFIRKSEEMQKLQASCSNCTASAEQISRPGYAMHKRKLMRCAMHNVAIRDAQCWTVYPRVNSLIHSQRQLNFFCCPSLNKLLVTHCLRTNWNVPKRLLIHIEGSFAESLLVLVDFSPLHYTFLLDSTPGLAFALPDAW